MTGGLVVLPWALSLTRLGGPAQLLLHCDTSRFSQACQVGLLPPLMEVHHQLGLLSETHILMVRHRGLPQLVVLLGQSRF